jgi:hypothetical protein
MPCGIPDDLGYYMVSAAMREERPYEWQIIGDGDEYAETVAKVGNDLVWCIAKDGDSFLFRGFELHLMLQDRIDAWSDPKRRQSKRLKDLADIARLVEAHPKLWESLTDELRSQIEKPAKP